MENCNKNELTNENDDRLEFVSSIITNQKGNVLILKRRKDLKLDPGKFDFCSGHMKEGEIPIGTMLRELNEEIGMTTNDILSINKIGDIETPHDKLKETVTHLYHVETNMTLKQINNNIKNMENPEMEKAVYLKSITTLRTVQEDSNLLRSANTKQMKIVLDTMEKRMKNRKEKSKELCEEK